MAEKCAQFVEVSCPLCQSDDWDLYVWAPSHYGKEKLRVVRCRKCRMIYTSPRVADVEETIESRGVLDRHFLPDVLRRKRMTANLQLGMLAKIAPGRRLFDFGAGEGVLVAEAIRLGWEAVGHDLNRGLVAAANRRWDFNALHSGSLDDFALAKEGSFDAVVSNQVFEHLCRPVETGRKLVSMLRPGGVLYLDVPNVGQFRERWKRGDTLDPTAHVNHFTPATLMKLMNLLACRVIYCSAAPSLVQFYSRLGLKKACYALGRLTKRLLPPIGTGVCVMGEKRRLP